MPDPHLKPCPFCGCEEVFLDPIYSDAGVQWEGAVQIGCAGCQLNVSCGHSTIENMAELWNRRDQRGHLSMPSLPPMAIEKHRIALDGTETVSFYACGPTRANRDEALADARRFAAKEENSTHG